MSNAITQERPALTQQERLDRIAEWQRNVYERAEKAEDRILERALKESKAKKQNSAGTMRADND